LETTPFMHRFVAGWAEMDWNRHMANTAYLDKAVDARVLALGRLGLTMDVFARQGIGVVVMADELQYRREVNWMDAIDIDFALAGLAEDASRFKVRNRIFRGGAGGELCATVTSTGGFMDLARRVLVAPPQNVAAAYRALPKTVDYETLPSSVRAPGAAQRSSSASVAESRSPA
jgi:acyl-CoA thioester hydrolase